MIQNLWKKWNVWKRINATEGIGDTTSQYTSVFSSLTDNMIYFNGHFSGAADYVHRPLVVCGHQCELIYIDNMIDKVVLTESILLPLTKAKEPAGLESTKDKEAFYIWMRDCVLSMCDQHEVFTMEEIEWLMMNGFAVLFVDGYAKGIAFGIQGFKLRGIDEPSLDRILRGSREGFIEALRLNIAMVRRRMKNTNLQFETYILGKESKTEVCLVYLKGVVADSILTQVRKRLKTIDMETVLSSGMIQPFFEEKFQLFSSVGYTERPDTLCAKLNEGRVGIMVDGTPMALFVPYLFIDNFASMDDYAVSFFYGTFTRILKYIATFISIFLPALYVAIGSFHQEILPTPLLYTLAQSEQNTPFSLTVEAILMQIIYEILREAGLRAPRQFGSSLNIVGAFLIGQAAVSAGLIGAPMVIIVSLTATTSLVVPTLYEPCVILRFVYIILAGMAGFYGITIGFAFFFLMTCSIKSYGVPYLSPYAPFDLFAMRDAVVRSPWKVLNNQPFHAQDYTGANVPK
ncbi:MAG TPA: spore germination protein [Ruminococcaceae bacterium]|nr:spore germination protein [Oscillospiraceae bacterium]